MAAIGPVLVIAPFSLLALFVIWLPVQLVWDVGYWWFAGGYALAAVLLFVRPIQALVLTPLFGARRPTAGELDRIAPIWRDLAVANDLPPDRYIVRVLPSDELNAFACGGHLVVVTSFALETLPSRELAGVLAHELSHHLGMHTVGLTIGHWLSLPVVAFARIGFWLQNVATAATDVFAKGSSGLTILGQLAAGILNVLSLPFVDRPLRRRRPRQRRRPPLRAAGRPPRRADGLRAQPGPRPAAGDQPRRRPAPDRLAGPPGGLAPAGADAGRPHRRHAPPSVTLTLAAMSPHRRGDEERDQICGGDAEVEAAAAAADVDGVVELAGLVDDGRQLLALAERADAAEHVAGDPLGHCRVAHLDPLAPERRHRRPSTTAGS